MRRSPNAFLEVKSQSNRYREAVRVLEQLGEEEGWDNVERAYSEATTDAHFDFMTKHYGKAIDGNIGDFLRKRGSTRYSLHLPGGDHMQRWRKRGDEGFGVFTSEPYSMSVETMRELVQFCEQYDLVGHLQTGSSHFPARCLLLVLKRRIDRERENWRPGHLQSVTT